MGDSTADSPPKIYRKRSDFKFFVLFAISFICWIILGYYVKSQGAKIDVAEYPQISDLKIISHYFVIFFMFVAIFVTVTILCVVITIMVQLIIAYVTWGSIVSSIVLLGIYAITFAIMFYGSGVISSGICFLLTTATIIFLAALISTILFRKEIEHSIEMLQVASEAIDSNLVVRILPFYKIIIQICIILLAASNHNFLSSAKIEYQAGETHNYVTILKFFNIFELIWVMCFVSALLKMCFAEVFYKWFWTNNEMKMQENLVLPKHSLKCLLGTLAFGSLISAIATFMEATSIFARILSTESTDVLQDYHSSSMVASFFGKSIKLTNKYSYIFTTIYATDYVTSTKIAVDLIRKYFMRVIVLETVTTLVLVIISLLISCTICLCHYIIWKVFLSEVQNGGDSIIITFILVCGISMSFLSYYSVAANAAFVCYLQDLDQNNGIENEFSGFQKLRAIVSSEKI